MPYYLYSHSADKVIAIVGSAVDLLEAPNEEAIYKGVSSGEFEEGVVYHGTFDAGEGGVRLTSPHESTIWLT